MYLRSVVNQMLDCLSGYQLSGDAIKSLQREVLIDKHGLKKGDTPAQNLIKMLQNTEGIHYYYYITGSYDDAQSKVRVRKKKKTKQGMMVDDVKDLSKEAKAFVKSVIKGMYISPIIVTST